MHITDISVASTEISQEQTLNTNYKINEILDLKEKIMEYNARTGETKEVNIEELELELKSKEVNQSKSTVSSFNSYKIPSLRVGLSESAQRITNVQVAPYNRVCRLEWRNENNGVEIGSASIVGNRVALTAAHCVWDSDTKKPYKNWTAYPGYTYNSSAHTSSWQATPCGWDRVYYSEGWMTNTDPQNFTEDWAICILQADVGNKVGYFDLSSYSTESSMMGLPVTVFGYLGDIRYGYLDGGKYQYKTGNKITQVGTAAFLYDAYTVGGFSGGPIVRDSDNFIVGVHAAGQGNKYGFGVRITSNMIKIILNNR